MAKTMEDLRVSREIKSKFLAKFGMIPNSILRADFTERPTDLTRGTRSYATIAMEKLKQKAEKKSLKELVNVGEFSKIFSSCSRSAQQGGLSVFPQNLGRLVVEFYCPKDGVIYDPFAGHNSRMELCFRCQRDYIGVDVSHEFMEYNRRIAALLQKPKLGLVKAPSITLIEHSSARVPEVKSNSADFTVTSPPYWNLEYYGDEPEQLGNTKTYESFLEHLASHVKENGRILRPGSFACWFVNDFRKGRYFAYHADIVPLFESAGFELFTIYIVNLGRAVNECFVADIIKKQLFPKAHEYCMVFRKVENTTTTKRKKGKHDAKQKKTKKGNSK